MANLNPLKTSGAGSIKLNKSSVKTNIVSGLGGISQQLKNSKLGTIPKTEATDTKKGVIENATSKVEDVGAKVAASAIKKGLSAYTGGLSNFIPNDLIEKSLKKLKSNKLIEKSLKKVKKYWLIAFLWTSLPLMIIVLLVSTLLGGIIAVANETICNDNFFANIGITGVAYVGGQASELEEWKKLCIKADTCENGGSVISAVTFEAGGLTIEAPEFIPDNNNLFHALIGITGKESGGKLNNKGDRDSVGPYQQRVDEYMTGQGEKGKVAKEILGSKFDEIFTAENKDFISQANAFVRANRSGSTIIQGSVVASGGNNSWEYGTKMREIAQKLVDGGGRKLFDQIQLARFKDASGDVYSKIVDFNLTKDNVTEFVEMVFQSHGVGANQDEWRAIARRIIIDALDKNIYSELSKNGSSNSAECKVAGGIGEIKPGDFMVPTEGIITRCAGHGYDACDIASGTKPPIYASKSGKVVIANTGCALDGFIGSTCGGGFGNWVKIDHGGGFTTIYAHLSEVKVTVGQEMKQGDVLGIMGDSGNSTGTHLHFEIREGVVQITCKTLFGGGTCRQGELVKPQD